MFLTSFGRFWDAKPDVDILIGAEPWREGLVTAREPSARSCCRAATPASARRLSCGCWPGSSPPTAGTVFEAGSADLMAGQQWFGQLEDASSARIDELAASKKLIWYIPDILQVALSGTHQGQAASILDQILPAMAPVA